MIVSVLMLLCVLQQPVEVAVDSVWTRKTESESLAALELVSRRYVSEGKPDVWLVGVAHIADASFYKDITALLDELDFVLYESVRPTGAKPPSGVTEIDKIKSTQESVHFVADIAFQLLEETGEVPTSIEDVVAISTLLDRRYPSWIEDASVDAWGRPFVLQVHENKPELAFTIWSFGKDEHSNEDNLFATRSVDSSDSDSTNKSSHREEKTNIQLEFADALDFEFQLDSLPYEEPNWFCSDLTIDEVEAKLLERGADTAMLELLTGESIIAKISSGMVKLLPLLDSLAGGGVKETARLLIIEMLSMAESGEILKSQDPELMQVIIVDRNTELLKDLAATIDIVEDVTTIGVLYGAGHMPDLERRIHTIFGYTRVEERWFTTMSVNPKDALLDEGDLKRMRFMLRFQMYKAAQNEVQPEEPTN